MDQQDPRPPFLLCASIALATIFGCCTLVWLRQGQATSQTTAAVAASTQALAQVLELKQIYSHPAVPEDPATYRKAAPALTRHPAKNSAKNTQ